MDRFGDVFFADTFNQRIRRVDAASGIITTVAGSGPTCAPSVTCTAGGFSGDGGPATSAILNFPYGMALDASGNLFIADLFNWRVRRVDAASGIITTVAGNGFFGFSGDGGPATSASVVPRDVAVDNFGNLFIADSELSRIRRVDARTGIITTVAGNGTAGFSGDGCPATGAELNHPFGVTAGLSADFFIADFENHRVRRASGYAATDFATGFVNNGSIGPAGLAFDASGNPYVGDIVNGFIYKFGPGGGVASAATQLNATPFFLGSRPHDMAFGKDGRFYVNLVDAGEVVELDPSNGTIIRTVATGIPVASALAVDPLSGDLFVDQSGGGSTIFRISNFASGPGTVTV